MQLNRVNVPNEGATGVDLTNAANGDSAVVQGRAGIGLVRTHDIKVWRGRELGDKALQRIAPPPGKLLAQPIKGGWLGRVRHMLQERAERVQEQSAQRQAALGLEQSPAVQVGPKWLTSLGSFRSRLQSIVAALKERVASVPSATAQATAQSVPSGPVLQTVKAAAAQVAATVQSAGGKEIKEGVVYSTIKTAAPDSTTNADAAALAQVTAAVQQRFAAQAGNKESFTELLKQAFGDKFDAAKAEAIRQQALAGDFSWAPKIQVVSSQALADLSGTQAAGSAKGAYVQDTDTIYISRELLQNDSQEAQRILMEEIGHGIDARINTSDAVGDEGEIFAKLMHGEHISAPELAALKADNDHGVVNINGRNVTVEYGWLKKAFKAITGGIKKVVSAVVKGAVDLAKSAVKVTVGLATFNFDKVKEGFKEGVNAVKSTVKTVVKAVKDTAKELHKIVKEAFVKLMQSKIFAIVLTICRFIPIPVVQLVVRVVDVVRSAYMVYQGIKNKSLSMVLGGVASLASGGAKLAGSLGASASTISTIKTVADAASKLSMAYNAVANKDIGAALSLLGGAVGGPNSNPTLNNLVTVGGYAQQAIGIGQAIKNKDVLGALSGGLGLAGTVVGSDSPESRNISQNLADAKEVVTGLQVVREIDRGNLDGAHALASNMNSAQQASQKADATLAQQRADEEAAAQAAKNRSLLNQADKDLRAQAAEQEGEPQEAKESQASPQETAAADEYRNGSDIDSDNMAERNGGVGPGSSQSLLTVSKGQTLEAIARAQYGENWRAGLTQIMLDNNIKLNQWGSPILSVGKTLVLNDLSGKSEAELASLARTGGRIISNNDKGLAAKAELEERARQAAAQKVQEAQSSQVQGESNRLGSVGAAGNRETVPAASTELRVTLHDGTLPGISPSSAPTYRSILAGDAESRVGVPAGVSYIPAGKGFGPLVLDETRMVVHSFGRVPPQELFKGMITKGLNNYLGYEPYSDMSKFSVRDMGPVRVGQIYDVKIWPNGWADNGTVVLTKWDVNAETNLPTFRLSTTDTRGAVDGKQDVTGEHAVSGAREISVQPNANGGYTIVNLGVSRATRWWVSDGEQTLDYVLFRREGGAQNANWERFMTGLGKKIEENGGVVGEKTAKVYHYPNNPIAPHVVTQPNVPPKLVVDRKF